MEPTIADRINAIDWPSFVTAYGPAVRVPEQLLRLAGADRDAATKASHDLWSGLCHGHAYVASASLPALPFLIEILDKASDELAVEILDILLGFAACTQEGKESVGPEVLEQVPGWVCDLRRALEREAHTFERFANHSNEEISDFAKRTLEFLKAK